MSSKLSGKVAFVTGASRGIGRAIALRLAKDGAKVALNFSSNIAKAEEVKATIESSGGAAMLVQGDVSSLAVVTELIKKVVDDWGRLEKNRNIQLAWTCQPCHTVDQSED